ncbi:glucose-6-phosphate isomerase [Lysinibacillus sp. 2017]|uniref:glucose-6-phosphate isomerase n=1 Tax=unclassified Lysinibacillus TaxID=2636778 RepID=UPI000D526CBA|nr:MULTISPECIES: glucose-6-phosphate isomerase [unclassified Lysinibacillus]AWE06772.1 glucose-6-phosphate isomerase [Lysinibacillus sp. 2017]TGN37297.1 glucose-6-phosphate isomerase [Lysinibacillus sp. S2017]
MIQLLQTGILNESLIQIEWGEYTESVAAIHRYLEETNTEMTGWLNSPIENNVEMVKSIQRIANEIKMLADVLVVIGVGGSFLGAKAIQDALTPYFGDCANGIEVVYVGQNMSGAYIRQLLGSLEHKEIYVNVISKSGTTMEPALAFRVFRKYMEKRYGDEAHNRIIVTTDAEKGLLKKIAENSGYRQFVIPANIGGRYSVLTPVGLLPIAVAGVDIEKLLEGAKKAATLLKNENLEQNEAYRYAVIRHALYKKGYQVELLASFEPSLTKLHEWWRQLFGESEGKEKRGLFPATVSYSTDLHAIGQFIQDGNPIIFETLLHFKEILDDYQVPYDDRNDDQLNYLSNRSFNEINAISKQGTAMAHADGGVPIIQLELECLDAYHLGYLLYFFMKACAMSAYLLQVNPFDQPGVEGYKNKMLQLLQEENVYK